MNLLTAQQAGRAANHPEWPNVHNRVVVALTTYEARASRRWT
ncbi:hypothetical protein ACFLUM_00465 [Chloroflexota bacterium]